ncbi:hypothetical protein [Candidatus Aquicultor secundus]|uniref:Glucuronosyltransferase n=1 Tax=Candidatus Aquicultor secundus TaxID=1973895 RepID=A0A2M7T4R6_9ACTN|nr:hypothetical protein [Candidatus Aquicultor secundus]PIZ34647.1 MAG: glucuronosyltransferase [Candidatus Aquicultor secundus]
MKRVVLITGHYWRSNKKAGFHWLADAFHRNGSEVLFFTCSLSLLSFLRRDKRLQYDGLFQARNRLIAEEEGLWSFVWFTPWHPANLRAGILNKLSTPLFRRYGSFSLGSAESFMQSADVFIIESGPGLLLVPYLKRLRPDARFVYRVSDDLRFLRSHPVVIQAEEEYVSRFDLVSVPSTGMLKLFEGKTPHLELHLHGINKELFDADYPNPYAGTAGPNLVFVGVSHFDIDFLDRASRLFPTRNFHIIGPIDGVQDCPNVKIYGELDFLKTVPFIKHADIGLATRSYMPGAELLGDSLKIIQYTYCRLSIVAPSFISTDRPNIIFYHPGDDESIRRAMLAASTYNRSQTYRDDIKSWDELAELLEGGQHA